MKQKFISILLIMTAFILYGTGPAIAASYFGYNDFGGTWSDANKSGSNTDDDLMCWAATASNMLAYSGWGFPGGESFADENKIFSYFQYHWTDAAGNMSVGNEWWFSGVNTMAGVDRWSQVDIPGGGFYTNENFSEYYTVNSGSSALNIIDDYLHQGYAVGISLLNDDMGLGHTVTAWGYEYDQSSNNYKGLYLTDSDDNVTDLMSYAITFESGAWYLQNFYGSNDWLITEVQGLAQQPPVVPIPSAIFLLGSCIVGILGSKRFKI